MFYIDIWEGRMANWIPFFGGQHVALWPIFNVADASIFVGVIIILIWQKKFFDFNKEKSEDTGTIQEISGEISDTSN